MSTPPAPELPVSTLPAYEQLRAEALGERLATAQGLAVLLRRGMLAWSELRGQARPLIAPRAPLAAPSARDRSLAPEVAADVVQILAGMVLASRTEGSEHV